MLPTNSMSQNIYTSNELSFVTKLSVYINVAILFACENVPKEWLMFFRLYVGLILIYFLSHAQCAANKEE